jgi:hypothetical protein
VANTWTGQTGKATNPLNGFEGRPIISGAGRGRYLGRVVIEVWESPDANDTLGAKGLAYMPDAATGVDWLDLLRRVAAALPTRIAGDYPKL